MKNLSILLFTLFALNTHSHSQDLFTISLKKFSLKSDSISVSISEIIDARKDKRVIGIIQLGIKNRKDLAVFEKPGLQEVEELISRSNLMSKEKGLAIRISKLTISEITGLWRETARAELSIDFFIPYQNHYYYISSVFTTVDPNGLDVTRAHPANIATAIEKALIQFSSRKDQVNSDEAFLLEDLTDPNQNFRNISAMPIIQATRYNEGYYRTFDEFVNNKPSIDVHCKVKTGTSPQIKCGEKEESVSIYGYSKENQLFILFHHDFYLLERGENGFFFRGPREFSTKDLNDYAKSWVLPSIRDRAGYKAIYTVDLSTGSIENATGF